LTRHGAVPQTAPNGAHREVNGPAVTARNSFETPRAVDVTARRIDVRGSRLAYTFPAHSITLMQLTVARS
jgi:hypothetical protein